MFTGIQRIAWAAALLAASTATAWGQHGAPNEDGVIGEPRQVVDGQIAPLLDGLGDHHFKITTDEPLAQTFFNQGLSLDYAFNHKEAERTYNQVQALDPDCAMGYWGEAMVLGQNLNQAMQEDAIPKAWQAIQKAKNLKENASEKEQALIDALATRYSPDPNADRQALNETYMKAMEEVAQTYPDDPDVLTMFAASIMNTMPWDYWYRDGRPKDMTTAAKVSLERAIDIDPKHPGAHHYRIHLLESQDPYEAESSADALVGLMPAAGHLVHMPSHIFIQTGRYQEAYEANVRAIAADEGYITQCRQQGIYPLSYYPHNIHFMYWAALFQGRSEEALEAAEKIASKAKEAHAGAHFGLYDSFLAVPIYTIARFGMWDKALELPDEDLGSAYYGGMRHYARGLAYANKDEMRKAKKELKALKEAKAREDAEEQYVGFAQVPTLLEIASEVLAGEMASLQGKHDDAIVHLSRAVRLQDGLPYNEPPDWYYPVRHSLGAALLRAERYDEAEQVYWDDLERFPDNGWSLYGLQQVYKAQGNDEQAAEVEERFEKSWQYADVQLASSRF